MREIKFRAWDKKGKGFINGFNMYGFSTGQGAPVKSLHRFSTEWSMDDVELMQYTGLNDCKRTEKYPEGQPIYEGDICKDREGISIIVFDSLQAAFVASFETDSMDIFSYLEIWKPEVIGNIHENPELLEVANNEQK